MKDQSLLVTLKLAESTNQLGMHISAEKSNVMKIGSRDELDVSIDGENLESVTQSKNVGATRLPKSNECNLDNRRFRDVFARNENSLF